MFLLWQWFFCIQRRTTFHRSPSSSWLLGDVAELLLLSVSYIFKQLFSCIGDRKSSNVFHEKNRVYEKMDNVTVFFYYLHSFLWPSQLARYYNTTMRTTTLLRFDIIYKMLSALPEEWKRQIHTLPSTYIPSWKERQFWQKYVRKKSPVTQVLSDSAWVLRLYDTVVGQPVCIIFSLLWYWNHIIFTFYAPK